MPVKRSNICTCALEAYRRGNLDYIHKTCANEINQSKAEE